MDFRLKVVNPDVDTLKQYWGISDERIHYIQLRLSVLNGEDGKHLGEQAALFAEVCDTPEEFAYCCIQVGMNYSVHTNSEMTNAIIEQLNKM